MLNNQNSFIKNTLLKDLDNVLLVGYFSVMLVFS